MDPHIRALVAAATFASVTGKKVAGLFDHTAGRDLRIAAECRGNVLQGFDGERASKFGGTLPEIFDDGEQAFVSFERDGARVKGFDRASGSAFDAQVTDDLVQVYDHSQGAWFAYDVQDAGSPQSYHRS